MVLAELSLAELSLVELSLVELSLVELSLVELAQAEGNSLSMLLLVSASLYSSWLAFRVLHFAEL